MPTSISSLALLQVLCIFLLLLIPEASRALLQKTALIGSVIVFCYTLTFWFGLSPYETKFSYLWCPESFSGYSFCFGLDYVSYYLVLLTTFIFPFCFLMVDVSVQKNLKQYLLAFWSMEIILFFVFISLDFLLFYIFFEISLIPMFLLIGRWGVNVRKTKAAYYLFLYTFFGSLFLLIALLYLLSQYGTLQYHALLSTPLDIPTQKILWPAVFFAFAIKVPMFPLHIWLPEAHVEAPTGGSVVLAALFLKMGGYGMLRFLLPLFPDATSYFAPVALTLALMGAVYASLTALRQLDMKRIVAYSSVAHMNVGLVGLFSLTSEGAAGFYYVMLGHGVVSSALFFIVGILYDRYHSRLYTYYSGVALRMPLYAMFFCFFTVANVAFPGTWNFVGELLICFGLGRFSLFLLLVTGFSLFFSTVYSFWLYNRICFGTIRVSGQRFFYDLTYREFFVFLSLSLATVAGGLFPSVILESLSLNLLAGF